MAYTVNKVDMWAGEIDDRVGGLAAKLEALANAGADLEVVVARRQPGQPGKGVVFLGPVKRGKPQEAEAHGITPFLPEDQPFQFQPLISESMSKRVRSKWSGVTVM